MPDESKAEGRIDPKPEPLPDAADKSDEKAAPHGQSAAAPPVTAQPDKAQPRGTILPRAGLRKKKSTLWPTLVILALVGIVGFFVAHDRWKPRERITVWFNDIHSLRVGSPVEHLGDQVGEIVEVGHPDDLSRRKVVIELVPDKQIVERMQKQGNHFFVSRFSSDRLQLKGVTKVIRGPSIVVRLGDPAAPVQTEFEGSDGMPPDPRLAWNSVRTTIYFTHVQDMKEGAFVTDRGQEVGVVEKIKAEDNSDYVKVSVAFFETDPAKCRYIREETRYFINKAKLTTRGVEGDASTVLYGAFVAVIPDPCHPDAKIAQSFYGQWGSPPEHLPRIGEKQVTLETSQWIAPDTPLFYRGDLAGYVHSIRQSSDSNSFYAAVRVYPSAVPQVCENSVFFFQQKLKAQLFKTGRNIFDIQGPKFEIPDPQLLLRPAIEFRTPPDSGKPHRFAEPAKPAFTLHAEPKEDWLKWNSSIPLDEPKAGPDQPAVKFPRPASAKFHWREAWKALISWRKYEGMVLPVPGGVIGLKELLEPDVAEKNIRKATFEIAGAARTRPATPEYKDLGGGIRFMRLDLEDSVARCPASQLAAVAAPVDIWVVTDPDLPRAVAAAKLSAAGDRWNVAADAGFQPNWHGAPVVCRDRSSPAYGKVIGIFVVGDKGKSGAVALFGADIAKQL